MAVLFQHCSNVWNCYGFSGLQSGTGILHSKFVGLANFEYMFQMSDIKQVLRNTVVIAVGKIIGNIIIPLVFALLLNELALKKLKRPIQTIVYLPYFLSWVILAKIVLNIFGYTGPVNQIIEFFGGEAVNFFWRSKDIPASGDRYGYLERIRLQYSRLSCSNPGSGWIIV